MMASHDLKTPTRTLTSFLGLIERTGELKSEAAKEYLKMATTGAKQLNSLLEGISEFRNTTHDKPKTIYTPTKEILKRVIDNMGLSTDKSISVEIKDMPYIRLPDTDLFHIFQNLIVNSIKYNSKPQKYIHITSRKTDTHIYLEFKDNGIGIEKEYLDYIFEPFKKLNASHKYESSGLGLAICRKIITRNGGTITAHSEGLGLAQHFL